MSSQQSDTEKKEIENKAQSTSPSLRSRTSRLLTCLLVLLNFYFRLKMSYSVFEYGPHYFMLKTKNWNKIRSTPPVLGPSFSAVLFYPLCHFILHLKLLRNRVYTSQTLFDLLKFCWFVCFSSSFADYLRVLHVLFFFKLRIEFTMLVSDFLSGSLSATPSGKHLKRVLSGKAMSANNTWHLA